MIGTLTFAVMAVTMSATPCEGLKSISLPNTTITTAEFVPEGPQQPAGGARGGGAPAGAPAGVRGGGGRGGPGGAPAGAPDAAPAGARGGDAAAGGRGGRGQ